MKVSRLLAGDVPGTELCFDLRQPYSGVFRPKWQKQKVLDCDCDENVAVRNVEPA